MTYKDFLWFLAGILLAQHYRNIRPRNLYTYTDEEFA